MPKVISVFGSSRPRDGEAQYQQAQKLGAALAESGFEVCTGGYGGVMEAVSRGASEAGGKVLAVTAEFFRAKPNHWVSESFSVRTWEERLFELIRRGDGYAVCAGGTGTLVELAVVWEMLNKGVISGKPVVALGDFWRPIVERVREVETGHASSWREAGSQLISFAANASEAAHYLVTRLGVTEEAPKNLTGIMGTK
jgi:uncharacterized protein (TIGR00730 family)